MVCTKLILLNFLEILLRVPSIFLLDRVFQSEIVNVVFQSVLLSLHKETDFDHVAGESQHVLFKPYHSLANYNSTMFANLSHNLNSVIQHNIIEIDPSLFPSLHFGNSVALRIIGGYVWQLIFICAATSISLFTLTLWTKHLVKMYEFLFAVALVVISQHLNKNVYNVILGATEEEEETWNSYLERFIRTLPLVMSSVSFQFVLATVYLMIQSQANVPYLRKIIVLSFVLPSLTLMLPSRKNNLILGLEECYFFLIAHLGMVVLFNTTKIFQEVKERVHYVFSGIQREGIVRFTETEWLRLNVPLLLRCFWLIRLGILIHVYVTTSESGTVFDTRNVKLLLQILLIRGCESFPSVAGMSSIFSWICAHIHQSSQYILDIPYDESSHVGPIAGILLLVGSYQHGLTMLRPSPRIVRLVRIVILIAACFLHFFHHSIDAVLMSLAVSGNRNVFRHVKSLLVSGFLIYSASIGLYFLWSTYGGSTWLLAVTGFGLEAVIKIIISLTLYGLFLVDSSRSDWWHKMDDYVYRLKFTGRVIEMVIGVGMLGNSVFTLLFENDGIVSALLFGWQGYCSLWNEAKVGWKLFNDRRVAVQKIATFETARHFHTCHDTCAICFHRLNSISATNVPVKVTPCQHNFHSTCLRKWLYLQDRCPVCRQNLTDSSVSKENYSERNHPEPGLPGTSQNLDLKSCPTINIPDLLTQ